jgi:hypothetical protein
MGCATHHSIATLKGNTMRKFWVYCIDTATGVRFFFPFIGIDANDCRDRIIDREILKPGEIIDRIEA